MRKQFVLYLFFFLAYFSEQLAAQTDLQMGLIAYYPFNGNANDESGNGNHGVIMNQVYFENGINGQCIRIVSAGEFIGSSGGHIVLPFINFNEMNEFTVSLWVNEESMAHEHGESYIYFGDHAGDVHNVMVSHFGDHISFGAGTARISYPYEPGYNHNWIFYLLKFNNGQVTAYINGLEVGTEDNVSIDISIPLAALGRHWWYGGSTTSTRLNAKIDEVRIYNRELREQEIYTLYTEGQTNQNNLIYNISVDQRTDGGGLIDVFFSLNGTADLYNIMLEVSLDGGVTYIPVSESNLTGDLGSISTGINKHIVWNSLESFPNTFSKQAKIKITALNN